MRIWLKKKKEWRLFNQKRKRMRELLKNMESVQNGVNLELQKVHVLKTKKSKLHKKETKLTQKKSG